MRTSAIIGLLLLLILTSVYKLRSTLHGMVLERTRAALQTHFESQVEFSDFKISMFPRFRVTILGLVMRHKWRTDIPPLIQVQQVSIYANLRTLLRKQPHIAFVQLNGLQIHTPPRQPGGDPLIQRTNEVLATKYPVLIHDIRADDAVIVILRAEPEKPPRQFPIHHLLLHDVSFDRPASFRATLTNAAPRGEIDATGQFGPWLAELPRKTPAIGQYTFQNADLGTLKGIKGILSSEGTFSGPLDYLKVDGVTDTPDFSLRTTDHPMALHTDFSSIVDGTNGDTYLNKVTARFLHTTLEVSGKVVDVDHNIKGRTIMLDAVSQDARLEDLIRLAARGKGPAMTGSVRLSTNINLREGSGDLIDRLRITGQFGVGGAHFTSPKMQARIDTLSRKGQGHPKDTDISGVVSEMRGKFLLNAAVMQFSTLSFGVAGASVNLTGTYNVDSGALDFHGKLMLKAKPSQTTTGAKSFFLRAVDPFFRGKNAGTVLAIKVTGTKNNPSFGRDRAHASD